MIKTKNRFFPSRLKRKAGSNPLTYARYIALICFIGVAIFSGVLSFYAGRGVQNALIEKDKQTARILANYLDKQIFSRFTLPTSIGFGFISLQHPAQYRHLDQVVTTIIHGLDVERVRIFSLDGIVTYSTDQTEAGLENLTSPSIAVADNYEGPIFDIDGSVPYWKLLIQHPSVEPNSIVLRTTYPLRLQHRLPSTGEESPPILGILEFTQDLTTEYLETTQLQTFFFAVSFACVIILISVLLFIIKRAEKTVSASMAEEQRLTEELHQSEKLASMGRVIASIAHEIRNPLGIIQSSSELLLKRNNGADALTSSILTAIYDESKRLSQTVSDFLDYAKPHVLKKDPVDTAQLIQQALTFLKHEIDNKNIDVITTMHHEKVYNTLGDSDYLYRMIYNIISNAIQATGEGGTILINLAEHKSPEAVIELTFQDTGSGFAEEDLHRLTDPFFTTKDHGTGLGLAIVHNILTSHSGKMELSNAPEGGAIIRLTLPQFSE